MPGLLLALEDVGEERQQEHGDPRDPDQDQQGQQPAACPYARPSRVRHDLSSLRIKVATSTWTYWQTHLQEWPRKPNKVTETGLIARHAALWLTAGYSKRQISEALGYKAGATKSIWLRAADYQEWLDRQPIKPTDLGAVAAFEDMAAAGTESAHAAEAARVAVRRIYRTPRVVMFEEWERSPFGWPEPISNELLYGEVERKTIEEAARKLRAENAFLGSGSIVSVAEILGRVA